MNNALVSIIVPVYNAERFLARCIESILNQSYKNIEVLLINDGSKDNSGDICEYYAKKDNRVKVIHQKNSGPSVARNVGIEQSKGEYIQFVDSDDYVDNDMTESLVREMEENIDIVLCGFKCLLSNNNKDVFKTNIYPKTCLTKYEFLNQFGILFKDFYINYIFNKLYRRDIITNYNIRFDPSVGWGEDLLFNISYFNQCKMISIIDKLLYNYNKMNDQSITSSFNKDLFMYKQKMYDCVRKFLIENNSYSGLNKKIVEEKYAYSVIVCLENLIYSDINYNKEEFKVKIEEIIKNDQVRESLSYLKNMGIQGKIIAKAIERNEISIIRGYFKLKDYIKNKTNYIYRVLKYINDYSK